jgi:MazG family protein
LNAMRTLLSTVDRLRAPDGCPWDRAQTPESTRTYLVEETFEAVEAIDRQDPASLREELGDVLVHIAMLGHIAAERGWFTFDDIAQAANDKLIVRHPDLFGGAPAGQSWEERKARGRSTGSSALDGVPSALPALLRAHRVSEKAAGVGFDWPDISGVRAKVTEELGELDEAIREGEPSHIAEEFGDLLFSLVNLGRFLPATAEDALRAATRKFELRFREVERAIVQDGHDIHHLDAEALEAYWQRAKASTTPAAAPTQDEARRP